MRWQGRDRYVVFDACFAEGQRFLATLCRWRKDERRSERLVYVAMARDGLGEPESACIESDPACVDPGLLLADIESARAELAHQWPPQTPDIHRLSFDAGRVELLLAFGEPASWLPQWVAEADELCLQAEQIDALARQAGGPVHAFKALARLAAPNALLSLVEPPRNQGRDGSPPSLDDPFWRGARAAGFVPAASHESPVVPRMEAVAVHAPPFRAHRPPRRGAGESSNTRHAVIVGGGLAGCAAAWALAEQGWRSTVLEGAPSIAAGASGNPGGLFHGVVHRHDGVHAAFNRAASLEAASAVREAIDHHGVAGAVNGLLRLEEGGAGVPRLREMLEELHLPPDYVQALDADEAEAHAGIAMRNVQAAWLYATGGWVDPGGLARSFIERAGTAAHVRTNVQAGALVRHAEPANTGSRDGHAQTWRVLDDQGRLLEEADVVVLANALGAEHLLHASQPPFPPAPFGAPLACTRGQLTVFDAQEAGIALPRIPVAGRGYLLPLEGGLGIVGAASHEGDLDPALRLDDHLANLDLLTGLLASNMDRAQLPLRGRTGLRLSTPDRLPLIGPLPDLAARPLRGAEQARFVPRIPGLYALTAFGSRGITWAALSARILASWITRAPFPAPARLVDATDAARFVARGHRHGGSRMP